jgi:PAS domain S-box-containing protein
MKGLRGRLLLLVLFAIVPAFALMIYTAYEQRRVAEADAEADALRFAHFVSATQDNLIEGARQLLKALAQTSEVQRADGGACTALLRRLLREHGRYANLGAVRPNGDVFCSAEPLPGAVSLADRAWFRRAGSTRDVVIGEFAVDRITRQATLDLALPALDAAGALGAVVFASLDLGWLNRTAWAAGAELPPGASLTVIDRRGTVLVRSPAPAEWVGKTVLHAPIVGKMLAERQGISRTRDLDGSARLFGFTRFGSGSDLYVGIGLPQDAAFGPPRRVLARNLAGLGLIAVATLLAAWAGAELFVLRQVRALARATRALAAGDLAARAGEQPVAGELSELARAFDDMAEELQRREEALAASEKRYRLLFDRSVTGICRTRADGVILDCNDSFAQMLGFGSREEVIGRNAGEFYVDRADRERWVARLEPEGAIANLEACLRGADGGEIWVLMNIAEALEAGEARFEEHVLDITDRRRAEDARRQAAALRSVTTLATAASHEINNPLGVIKGNLQLLAREAPAGPARERIESALRACEAIQEIVTRMARIARLEAVEQSPNLPPMLDLRKSSEDEPR